MANAGKTLSWQFTKVRSIYRGFYKLKTMVTIKKVYSTIGNRYRICIFSTHLPIVVRYKPKGAVGAVCALLRNYQLGAYFICQLLYEMVP